MNIRLRLEKCTIFIFDKIIVLSYYYTILNQQNLLMLFNQFWERL